MTERELALGVARADLCRFLAACYYEPGPEFAEEKLFDSMRDVAALVDVDLADRARRLGEAFATEDSQELLIDYTRLFLGPIEAPAKPYGSVWLKGSSELMAESTTAVQELYGEGGFEIAEEFHDLPDHVCVELEFLYGLLLREAQTLAAGDDADCERSRGLVRQLLQEHLGRWCAPFTDAISRHAQTEFYRELSSLTRAFVERERERARVV